MKKENGQALVLVAVLMVVIFGFAALSVDIGSEVAHGNRLQKAADAAALAAATVGTSNNGYVEAAKNILQANGVTADNSKTINVGYNSTSNQYTVMVSQLHNFWLAPILGIKNTLVTRSATASDGGSNLGYAIINTGNNNNLQFDNNGTDQIDGNVHSNDGIEIGSNGNVAITGAVTYDGNTYDSPKVSGTVTSGSFLDMSKYFSQDFQNELNNFASLCQTAGTGKYDPNPNGGSVTLGGNGSAPISGPVYVGGNVTIINNGSIQAGAAIYATGSITIESNGGGAIDSSLGSSNPAGISLALYSANGDIIIDNHGGLDIYGLFYAPNGTIETHSDGQLHVYGSIIGAHVDFSSGGDSTIDHSTGTTFNSSGSSSVHVTYRPVDPNFPYGPQTQMAYLVKPKD